MSSDETFTLQPAGTGGVDENGEPREFDTIPEGTILTVECLGLERKLMPFKDKETGADVYKVEFSFRVTEDGQWQNRRLWGQTSTVFSTHEDCRLYQWVKSLLAVEELGEGFTFRANEMKGTTARAEVGVRRYTPRNSTEEKEVNFVGDLMPARQSAQPVMPQTSQVSAPSAAPAPTLASVASGLGAEEFGEEPF